MDKTEQVKEDPTPLATGLFWLVDNYDQRETTSVAVYRTGAAVVGVLEQILVELKAARKVREG